MFDGSRYPLDMFWHLVAHTPLTVLMAFVLLSLRMAGAGGEWTLRDRALHGLWLGWVLWFGVIDHVPGFLDDKPHATSAFKLYLTQNILLAYGAFLFFQFGMRSAARAVRMFT